MGKDSVIECVNEGGTVKSYASLTVVVEGQVYTAKRSDVVR